MSRRSRRSRHSITAKAAGYFAFTLLSIGGLGYAALDQYGQPTADEFGCYQSEDQTQSFVFFDASEPRFNDQQRRSLQNYFEFLFENIPFNEKLSFISTEGHQVASFVKPAFHLCGPARGSSDIENIGGKPVDTEYLKKQRQRVYEEQYIPYIVKLIAEDLPDNQRQTQQSPVLESIAAISKMDGFGPGARLTLAGDLLQSSDLARFCVIKNDMPPYPIFRQRAAFSHLKPNSLAGVAIHILLIQRDGFGSGFLRYCSSEDEVIRFYRDFFEANGTSDVSITRIRIGHVKEG